MRWPFRVTPSLLDVIAALLATNGRIHGWQLADWTGWPSPSVYRILDRLLTAGWVAYEWEKANPDHGRPPRRLYWLTEQGLKDAPRLLAERSGTPGRRWPSIIHQDICAPLIEQDQRVGGENR
jgi:DNA-binding PadR family transcriptional regulator